MLHALSGEVIYVHQPSFGSVLSSPAMMSDGSIVFGADRGNTSMIVAIVTSMDPGYYCARGLMGNATELCPPAYYCAGRGELTPCSARFYCPRGSFNQQPCPAGYYCPELSEEPKLCPACFFCEASSDQPQRCPSGFACAPGSAQPQTCDLDKEIFHESGCETRCFCLSVRWVGYVMAGFTAALLVILFGYVGFRSGHRYWIAVVLLSWGDLMSDVLYVTQSTFRNEILQWLSVLFLGAQAVPAVLVFRPQWRTVVDPLRYDYGLPFSKDWHNPYAAVGNLLFNIIKDLVYLCVIIPAGCLLCLLLYAAKLHSCHKIAEPFWRVWNPSVLQSLEGNSGILVEAYHLGILFEILTETFPQMVIQALNNGTQWGPFALMSIGFSAITVFSHAWRYIAYVWIDKKPLREVPMSEACCRDEAAPDGPKRPAVPGEIEQEMALEPIDPAVRQRALEPVPVAPAARQEQPQQ